MPCRTHIRAEGPIGRGLMCWLVSYRPLAWSAARPGQKRSNSTSQQTRGRTAEAVSGPLQTESCGREPTSELLREHTKAAAFTQPCSRTRAAAHAAAARREATQLHQDAPHPLRGRGDGAPLRVVLLVDFAGCGVDPRAARQGAPLRVRLPPHVYWKGQALAEETAIKSDVQAQGATRRKNSCS